MKFNNKKTRQITALIIIVLIAAMVLGSVIPYIV